MESPSSRRQPPLPPPRYLDLSQRAVFYSCVLCTILLSTSLDLDPRRRPPLTCVRKTSGCNIIIICSYYLDCYFKLQLKYCCLYCICYQIVIADSTSAVSFQLKWLAETRASIVLKLIVHCRRQQLPPISISRRRRSPRSRSYLNHGVCDRTQLTNYLKTVSTTTTTTETKGVSL